ncbi:MAG: hypothetical protein SX243_02410 [Acidobacteriota bacterium]|nr:hypothetical protein [Acidobacteriota bacterium]
MIYGDLIKIQGNQLLIEDYLLRPLGIETGGQVYCLYYPPRRDESGDILEDYKTFPNRHDIIVSPFRTELWPYLVRFNVNMSHRPGSLQRITEILTSEDVGMNILTTNVVRSGHRSALWNIILDCQKVRETADASLKTAESRSREAADYAKNRILVANHEARNKFLFPPDRDHPDLKRVSYRHLRDYYRYKTYTREIQEFDEWGHANSPEERERRARDKFIEGECVARGISITKTSLWRDIVLNICGAPCYNETIYALASIDIHSHILRISILPPGQLHRFRGVQFSYTFVNEPEGAHTTRGLLHDITKCFGEIDIWRVGNTTKIHSDEQEHGFMNFFLEAPEDSSHEESSKRFKELADCLERERSNPKVSKEQTRVVGPLRVPEWVSKFPPQLSSDSNQPREEIGAMRGKYEGDTFHAKTIIVYKGDNIRGEITLEKVEFLLTDIQDLKTWIGRWHDSKPSEQSRQALTEAKGLEEEVKKKEMDWNRVQQILALLGQLKDTAGDFAGPIAIALERFKEMLSRAL